MPEWLSNFINRDLVSFGLRFVIAVLLLVVGFFLVNLIVRRIRAEKIMVHLDPSTRSFVSSLVSVGAKVVIILLATLIAGLPSATIVAVLGSCGLALGLALQGGLSNIAGGIILMFLKPFKLGDYISAAGYEGTVCEMGVFYTALTTTDNRRIVIPNGQLTGGVIVNTTAEDRRYLFLDFSVTPECGIDEVKTMLMHVMAENALVLFDPPCDVIVPEITESSVTFRMRAWCKTEDYYTLRFQLNEAVRHAFTDNKIDAPVMRLGVKAIK